MSLLSYPFSSWVSGGFFASTRCSSIAHPGSLSFFSCLREFFFLLSQELFNPEYGLFLRGTEASNYNLQVSRRLPPLRPSLVLPNPDFVSLQINADSGTVDPEHHLQHFK